MTGAERRALRHRGPDFHRHLILANLERNGARRGAVGRTCFVLQILHILPHFQRVVLMGDKLRLAPPRVKSGPQYLVVIIKTNTTSCVSIREFNNLHGPVRHSPSSRNPPVLRWFSARSQQDFHSLLHKLDLRESSENPPLLHMFYELFSSRLSTELTRPFSSAFSCFFRQRSERKKGEKQAECEICGKARFGLDRPLHVVVESGCAHKLWHVEHFSFRGSRSLPRHRSVRQGVRRELPPEAARRASLRSAARRRSA